MCILGIYRSVFPHHFQGFHRSIKSNVFDDLSSLAEAISLSVDRSCWPGWPIHLQTNVYTATITTTTTTTTTNQNINHRQYSSVQSIDIYIYMYICNSIKPKFTNSGWSTKFIMWLWRSQRGQQAGPSRLQVGQIQGFEDLICHGQWVFTRNPHKSLQFQQ